MNIIQENQDQEVDFHEGDMYEVDFGGGVYALEEHIDVPELRELNYNPEVTDENPRFNADVPGNFGYVHNYEFVYNDEDLEWDAEYVRINRSSIII